MKLRWPTRLLVVATALVGAVPVALLAVFTAWLLSNRDDTAPHARPAALLLPAPSLPDDKNAFFALVGLSAEAGRDAAAVGQALWQVNLQRAALTQGERLAAAGYAELRERDRAALGQPLPAVTGGPLYCKAASDGCVAAWLAAPEALAAQRQQMAVSGARCDALFPPGTGFEERLPTPVHYAADLAPHLSGALRCSLWWRSAAVLAWQQGQPQQALAKLRQAAHMDRAVLVGSQTLISNLGALSMTRDTQATAVALALRDAALAPQWASLLEPVTDVVLVAAAKRWMAQESALQQTLMDELAECLAPDLASMQLAAGWSERQRKKFERWQCQNRVGFMPQRIKALFDDHWIGAAAALDGGLPAAIEHMERQSAQAQQQGWQWRNTVGSILHVVALPTYPTYLRRAADLALYSEAARLALTTAAQRMPAADRAAWAQRQPMSAALRERLRWDDSGQGFSVRTWLEESQTQPIEPRQAIRFTWPTSIQG